MPKGKKGRKGMYSANDLIPNALYLLIITLEVDTIVLLPHPIPHTGPTDGSEMSAEQMARYMELRAKSLQMQLGM